MRRVLIISIDNMSPLNSGYRKSANGRILEHPNDVDLLIVEMDIGENSKIKTVPHRSNVCYIKLYHPWTTTRLKKSVYSIRTLFSRLPRLMKMYSSRVFRRNISRIIEDFRPTEIVFESVMGFYAVDESVDIRKTINSMDILNNYLLEMSRNSVGLIKKAFYWMDYLKSLLVERCVFADKRIKHIFLTQNDAEYYHRKFGTLYELATNKLFVERVEHKPNTSAPFFLFAGSPEFSQNYAAIEWYSEKVYPQIQASRCNPILLVTGRCSEETLRTLSKYPFLKILGEISVSELMNLQITCQALLSPIVGGTGIKVKNLEAVQMGIPVIMTPHSAKGIEATSNAFVSETDSPRDFAKLIVQYIANNDIKGMRN